MAKVGLFPLSQKDKILANRRRRFGIRTARAVRLDYAAEVWLRKELFEYTTKMRDAINAQLITLIEREPTLDGATYDSFVDDIQRSLENLSRTWLLTNNSAQFIAERFASKMDETTTKRLQNSIKQSMGIDLVQMIQTEGIANALKSSIYENTRLIKTIPEQYLSKVEQIINQNSLKGGNKGSIIKAIQEVYPVTMNRARLIARDQSNKLNANITRERQTSLGIRAYRWRTVGDANVRKTHKERNGKVYAWRAEDVGKRLADGTRLLNPGFGPNDIGHPGDDIQCRCIAEPVIELDRIGLAA